MEGARRETGAIGPFLVEGLDARVAVLADRQHGVVSLAQLVELGLSASAVRKRAAAGRLHRVHRGVYAVGRSSLDGRGRRMAAVLACGPGAAISHRTAAAALGLLASQGATIEVSVPVAGGRKRQDIWVHRSPAFRPQDITNIDGIPCTTVARTLLDLAAVVDVPTLLRAIEAVERHRVFDLRAIEEQLERASGRPEARRLQAALIAYRGEPPPTREEFERRAFELFGKAGLPRPRVNVFVDTAKERLEVDFCWPDRRLVVEADSWDFHKTRAAFERDRRRDQLLHAAGWTSLRITWRQLTQAPEEIVAALAA